MDVGVEFATPAMSELTSLPSDNDMDVDGEVEPARPRRGTRRKANAVVVHTSESEDGEVREDDKKDTRDKDRDDGKAKTVAPTKTKTKAAKASTAAKTGSAAKRRKTDATTPVVVEEEPAETNAKGKKAGAGRKGAPTRREPDDQAGRAGLRVARAPAGGANTLPRSLRGGQA